MLTLYYVPGTCALAVWIALEWAGADYEAVRVDYHSAEYRKINPMGQVPALDFGDSSVLTQGPAVLQYVAARFPEAKLGPNDDITDQARFNEVMNFLAGDLHPAYWPYYVPSRYSTDQSEGAQAAIKQASEARVAAMLENLDRIIGDSGHVYGNRRTVADAFAYILAGWSGSFPKGWKSFPNLARFMERMKTDAAVQMVETASRAKADA